ncbi:MAG: 16S rRNA (guanine(527)-N(7))-methyltransferase RsmG [Eggerthellaceae bacterium]|nr:16S rRNA (guanine(527)-N(7))-methyltransferase RsmG [Eggerthellaceae bacterium]
MSSFEELDENKRQLIQRHFELVVKANETSNLTRITSIDEAQLLHIEDSLSGLPEMENAPKGLYGDMGSGAGYPGIPLSIATGRKTLLIDSRKKKMDIMASIIEELGLEDQIEVYAGRAELLARSRAGEFSVLTARALSKLSVLMELASPLLAKDGLLICYKSHIDQEEMDDALRVQKLVGMKLNSDRSFMLDDYERRIVTFRKSGKPSVRLPRLEGQAQKNPL